MSPHTSARQTSLVGDLVAFTALPAVWVGAPLDTVAASLASALDRTLPVEAAAVILRADHATVDARAGQGTLLDADVDAWRSGGEAREGTTRVPIGASGARGALLLRGPPLHEEALLLVRLAANLADAALREAALRVHFEASRDRLAKLEKVSALGQLVSGVAHELRTPLTYANNHLYMALARLERAQGLTEEERAAFAADLGEAVEAHDRITRTIRTLRGLSNPNPPRREPLVLSDAVAEAVRLFTRIHLGPARVVARLDATATVLADRAQVQQIVLNLLQNAAEALPEGGRVRVSTTDEKETACLLVEDTGPGVPSLARARVFEPFYTTKPGGTGLGLSIVKRIADEHDAVVAIGDAEGGGARFEIAFPRLPARTASALPPRPARVL